MCLENDSEEQDMRYVPKLSVVESLAYTIVRTKPHISAAVRVVSRFMLNLGKEYWIVVKRMHGTT